MKILHNLLLCIILAGCGGEGDHEAVELKEEPSSEIVRKIMLDLRSQQRVGAELKSAKLHRENGETNDADVRIVEIDLEYVGVEPLYESFGKGGLVEALRELGWREDVATRLEMPQGVALKLVAEPGWVVSGRMKFAAKKVGDDWAYEVFDSQLLDGPKGNVIGAFPGGRVIGDPTTDEYLNRLFVQQEDRLAEEEERESKVVAARLEREEEVASELKRRESLRAEFVRILAPGRVFEGTYRLGKVENPFVLEIHENDGISVIWTARLKEYPGSFVKLKGSVETMDSHLHGFPVGSAYLTFTEVVGDGSVVLDQGSSPYYVQKSALQHPKGDFDHIWLSADGNSLTNKKDADSKGFIVFLGDKETRDISFDWSEVSRYDIIRNESPSGAIR